jgi:ABC-type polysaccharide/polyol phosphate export permease
MVLYVWPVTPIVQFSRSVLILGVTPSLRGHLYLLGVTLFIFGGGALLFKRLAARAIEKL